MTVRWPLVEGRRWDGKAVADCHCVIKYNVRVCFIFCVSLTVYLTAQGLTQ